MTLLSSEITMRDFCVIGIHIAGLLSGNWPEGSSVLPSGQLAVSDYRPRHEFLAGSKRWFFTSDGVRVWNREWSRKRAYDLVKIKLNRSLKRSDKSDGIGVGRIRAFPFSSDSAYDSVAYGLLKIRLLESEALAEGEINHNARYHGFSSSASACDPTT